MLFSSLYYHYFPLIYSYNFGKGCRGRDRMVVGFTTTYVISVYHHWSGEFESRSGRGTQHYVIKFVSDLRQVGGFFLVLRFLPWYKSCISVRCICIFLRFFSWFVELFLQYECVGLFSFFFFVCFLHFVLLFFFIWIICVSFKSVSMTFRKLKVNYVMRYICLPVT